MPGGRSLSRCWGICPRRERKSRLSAVSKAIKIKTVMWRRRRFERETGSIALLHRPESFLEKSWRELAFRAACSERLNRFGSVNWPGLHLILRVQVLRITTRYLPATATPTMGKILLGWGCRLLHRILPRIFVCSLRSSEVYSKSCGDFIAKLPLSLFGSHGEALQIGTRIFNE